MQKSPASDLKSDEQIVFFATAAAFDPASEVWRVPVHGWVFQPEQSVVRKGLFAEAVEKKYGVKATPTTQANFDRRVNLFVADSERSRRIVVQIAGTVHVLPPSEPNGHFEGVVDVPKQAADKYSEQGRLPFQAVLKAADGRFIGGDSLLVSAQGISVISDIDDTVKISNVLDHAKLIEATFYNDFVAVPGMAERYTDWAKQNVALHFVSSSPWQLYEPLVEFFRASGFPSATFSLKYVRFKDSTFFNLFKKGSETKPEQIAPILAAYPQRYFVLIGDSGEQDPEVYGQQLRDHPMQILKVYIRNVSQARAGDPRFQQAFRGVPPEKWQLFDDPATLQLPAIR